MTITTPIPDPTVEEALADRLPLMPESDRADLADLIKEVRPVPFGGNLPPEEAWRQAGLIQRLMMWLGWADDPRSLPQKQATARAERADLVVYAQHRWESQLDDLTDPIRQALGVGPTTAEDVVQQALEAIGHESDAADNGRATGPGAVNRRPGWAAEPKRAIGRIIACLTGALDTPPTADRAAGFWAGQEEIAPVRTVGEASPILADDPDTDWRAISRAPETGRVAIDLWFDHLAGSDQTAAPRDIQRAAEALDRHEETLFDSLRSPAPSLRDWLGGRASLVTIAVTTLLLLITSVVPAIILAVSPVWHVSRPSVFDIAQWLIWLGQGMMAVIGWSATLTVAGFCLGYRRSDLPFWRPLRQTVGRLLVVVAAIGLGAIAFSTGPSLPSVRVTSSGDTSLMVDWPTSLVTIIVDWAGGVLVIILGFALGRNRVTSFLARRLGGRRSRGFGVVGESADRQGFAILPVGQQWGPLDPLLLQARSLRLAGAM